MPQASETIVQEVDVDYHGSREKARLSLSGDQLIVRMSTGQSQTLENPAGATGYAHLIPIASKEGTHLLVTAADDRITWGWVLLPGENGFSVALTAQADDGISAFGDAVKVSSRKYLDDGGYKVASKLYRFNPTTKLYEPS